MIEQGLPKDIKYYKAENLFYHDGHRLTVRDSDIIAIKNHRGIVVNASDECLGHGHAETYHRILSEIDCRFVLTTSDIHAHNPDKKIFWHHDGLHWSQHHLKRIDIDCHSTRTWDFACFNAAPRPYRVLNYLNFVSQPEIYDRVLFAMRQGNNVWPRPDDLSLTNDETDAWANLSPQWPLWYTDKDPHNFYKAVRDYAEPYWTESKTHIITETTISGPAHTTEKTWKSVAAGQLFIIYGNPHTVAMLRSIGVDCFDDIIDHGSYDSIVDPREKAKVILDLVGSLLQRDWHQIWHDTAPRRQSNLDKFWNGDFATYHDRELAEHIKSL